MTRALVLSAETPSAVATVRALHGAGFQVTVLAESRASPAGWSWRCTRTRVTGRWDSSDLVSYVLDEDADVIVPVTEGDLLRLGAVRSSVERLAPVVGPTKDTLVRALDKGLIPELVDNLNDIAAPQQVVLPRGEKVGSTEDSDFPLIAKPRRSRALLEDGTIWGATARWASSAPELWEAHREHGEGEQDTLLQRPQPGRAVLVSLLLHAHGNVALKFVHRRIRQARPDGGPSACAISCAPDDTVVEPAAEIARRLGAFRVPIQFEFVVPSDGVPVLLDINPRAWGTLGLALDAGVDFMGTAARHALGADLPLTPPSYEEGLVRHYLPFEVRHLLAALTGGPPAGYQGPWPHNIIAAALDWGYPPTRGLVGRLDDPLPALADIAHILRRKIS